jgi:hypothetical protein
VREENQERPVEVRIVVLKCPCRRWGRMSKRDRRVAGIETATGEMIMQQAKAYCIKKWRM